MDWQDLRQKLLMPVREVRKPRETRHAKAAGALLESGVVFIGELYLRDFSKLNAEMLRLPDVGPIALSVIPRFLQENNLAHPILSESIVRPEPAYVLKADKHDVEEYYNVNLIRDHGKARQIAKYFASEEFKGYQKRFEEFLDTQKQFFMKAALSAAAVNSIDAFPVDGGSQQGSAVPVRIVRHFISAQYAVMNERTIDEFAAEIGQEPDVVAAGETLALVTTELFQIELKNLFNHGSGFFPADKPKDSIQMTEIAKDLLPGNETGWQQRLLPDSWTSLWNNLIRAPEFGEAYSKLKKAVVTATPVVMKRSYGLDLGVLDKSGGPG